MTSSNLWEQWEGFGYSSEKLNPIIYYFPGKSNIEEDTEFASLVDAIHFDGVTPSKRDARELLEDAIVVHGQVTTIDGELHCSFGPESGYEITHDATWVELDDYEG